jgi:hypothetical protein
MKAIHMRHEQTYFWHVMTYLVMSYFFIGEIISIYFVMKSENHVT